MCEAVTGSVSCSVVILVYALSRLDLVHLNILFMGGVGGSIIIVNSYELFKFIYYYIVDDHVLIDYA